jgi:hypothetical protein
MLSTTVLSTVVPGPATFISSCTVRPTKSKLKARREFRTLQQWLAGADLLLPKADRQPPLVVLPVTLLAKMILSEVPS